MQFKWGTYQWFLEHGIDEIHPEDLESFKNEAHNCKIFQCVKEDEQYITLKYRENFYRVKNDLFKEVTKPEFDFGEIITLSNNQKHEAVITDIMWHYDKKEPYYFIKEGGKKRSKRYYETELRIKTP